MTAFLSLSREARLRKRDIQSAVDEVTNHRALQTDRQMAEDRIGGFAMLAAAIDAEKLCFHAARICRASATSLSL